MGNYATTLLESELPFGTWVAALTWAALFLASHWIGRFTRVAHDAQSFIAVENLSALHRGFEPKFILAQVLYAGIVFLFGLLLGGPGFVFFAGGLIVAVAYGLAMNVQGFLSVRALGHRNAATGTLTVSTAYAFRHMAYRLAAGALACLLIGLALAHLALLGGTLFLASTAGGYLRKARNERVQP